MSESVNNTIKVKGEKAELERLQVFIKTDKTNPADWPYDDNYAEDLEVSPDFHGEFVIEYETKNAVEPCVAEHLASHFPLLTFDYEGYGPYDGAEGHYENGVSNDADIYDVIFYMRLEDLEASAEELPITRAWFEQHEWSEQIEMRGWASGRIQVIDGDVVEEDVTPEFAIGFLTENDALDDLNARGKWYTDYLTQLRASNPDLRDLPDEWIHELI